MSRLSEVTVDEIVKAIEQVWTDYTIYLNGRKHVVKKLRLRDLIFVLTGEKYYIINNAIYSRLVIAFLRLVAKYHFKKIIVRRQARYGAKFYFCTEKDACDVLLNFDSKCRKKMKYVLYEE